MELNVLGNPPKWNGRKIPMTPLEGCYKKFGA